MNISNMLLRKQNNNMFLAILFTIIALSISNIIINLNHTGYPNNYLVYFTQFILVFVLLHRLDSIFDNKIIIHNINKSELLILISKIIYLLYEILLGIFMVFLLNTHTKPLFMNLFSVIRIISICSSILAIIALIIAPKREKYA